MDSETQSRIVRKAQSGGPDSDAAFVELASQIRRPLLNLCMNITGNLDDAKDAVQESFIAIHRQLPKFRGESSLTTWAFQIAIRVALRTRTNSRRNDRLDSTYDVAHPQLSPEHEVADRQLGRALAKAMGKLSPEHQLVLSLFAVDGLSHKEIADLLAIPEGTVWSRVHAARKTLHSLMEVQQ